MVLAVPYPAVSQVIATRQDQLVGKVVVDITNPLNFETFDSLTVPADSSAAAEIAAALPQSRVLKAFNTTFAGTLSTGMCGSLDRLGGCPVGQARQERARAATGRGGQEISTSGHERAGAIAYMRRARCGHTALAGLAPTIRPSPR